MPRTAVTDSIKHLTAMVQAFCEAREWDQFHGPKDLAISVITEASELLEHFRFLSEDEAVALLRHPARKEQIEDELADVLFFLLRFTQRFDIDMSKAVTRKLAKIEEKYPLEKSRGSNRKYTEL